jgi:hypothetical protein
MAKVTNQSNFNPAAFGQFGSSYVTSDDRFRPPLGYVVHAITALEDVTLALESDNDLMMDGTNHHNFTATVNGTITTPFIDTTSDSHGVSVGDYIYNGATFVGEVVSINTASDGTENLSMFEVDRIALLTPSTVLSIRGKSKGTGGAAASNLALPKGVTIYGSFVSVKASAAKKYVVYFAPISGAKDATS